MSDNLLLTSVFSTGQVTREGQFEVFFNHATTPAQAASAGPGHVVLNLPDNPRPLPVLIRLKSQNQHHWDIEGEFEYQGRGIMVVKRAPAEFEPPRGIFTSSLPGTSKKNFFSVILNAVLSRVRDSTQVVLTELGNVPTGVRLDLTKPAAQRHLIITEKPNLLLHPSFSSTWKTPTLPNFEYARTPPLVGGNVVASAQTITPPTIDLVLEVAHVTAPQMLAVSWPTAIARNAASGPTPFLIYIHPGMAQNVGKAGFYENNGQKPYPLGWDYLFYGLWRYINYNTSPFRADPWAKGLVYQMTASGKNAVLVLPLNKSGIESGVFRNASDTEEILSEVNAFFFRRAGIFKAPPLGRIALGGFSSGVALEQALLQSVGVSSSLRTLQEVYMFDRGHGVGRRSGVNDATIGAVRSAVAWAGINPTRIVRFYSQMEPGAVTNYRSLVGVTPPSGPSVTQNAGGTRTLTILPQSAWQSFAAWRRGDHLHQLISATMLTDALRRSGF